MNHSLVIPMVGLAGAMILLAAYGLRRALAVDAWLFHACNIGGAIIFSSVACFTRSAGFYLWNAVWPLIGLATWFTTRSQARRLARRPT